MLDHDLHCHSSISDGTLAPAELVHRAAERGVKELALTDHDDMDGLDEARAAAAQHGMTFINGVEISVTWRTHTVHIVGLNINPDYQPLVEGLRSVRSGRGERARKMAEELAKAGIGGNAARRISICGKLEHDRTRPFCALSGRSRALQGREERVQPLSGEGQDGLCFA